MANPLPNEEQLYKKIKREHIVLPRIIWDLLDHHVRNDLTVLTLLFGEYYVTPRWILSLSSGFTRLLYKVFRIPGPTPIGIDELRDIGLVRVKNIDQFLRKLKEQTQHDQECIIMSKDCIGKK